MKYKLLALDMDGTLLNSEKKISEKTARAIKELSARGIYVTLSTGRGFAELADYKTELEIINYGVLLSGGLVYDFAKNKIIAEHPLTEDWLMKLIDAGNIARGMIHILTDTKSLTRPEDVANMQDFQMKIYQDMFERNCTACEDFKKLVRDNPGKILKLNIYHRSSADRLKTFEKFKDAPLAFSFSEETSLEASPKNISKASGLLELCKFLNVDISETVAVGDAQNDTEVLQTAGFSVAMGNADAEIKKIADYITADNDNDGVAQVIEKFF